MKGLFMANPETGSQEGQETQKKRKFHIQFPDGSTAEFDSQMAAAEALSEWREAA